MRGNPDVPDRKKKTQQMHKITQKTVDKAEPEG